MQIAKSCIKQQNIPRRLDGSRIDFNCASFAVTARPSTERGDSHKTAIAVFLPLLKMIVLKALFVLTFLSKVEASYDSKFDFSSYEKNSPFFSKKLKDRLREWNKTLMNASRFCANRSINGTGIEEHIRFPVFDTKEIDDEFVLLAFETFHPVLVRKTNQHDLAKVAHLAIAELWPLLVLCFSCAALSGVIIWLLVSKK